MFGIGEDVQYWHIFSVNNDVRYEQGTSSVLARMCNFREEHLHFWRGCAVLAGCIIVVLGVPH